MLSQNEKELIEWMVMQHNTIMDKEGKRFSEYTTLWMECFSGGNDVIGDLNEAKHAYDRRYNEPR